MSGPICPANYKQEYLAIKYDYDTKCSMTEEVLQGYIDKLDTRVQKYETTSPDNRPNFCFNKNGDIIGYAKNDVQLYSETECKSLPNAIYNKSGECTKSTGGSYSWDCRPAAGSGGETLKRAQEELSDSFKPIAQYYADLESIKKRLQKFLECSTDQVTESQDGLLNEQRYQERAYPQHEVKPRELVFGLFSEMRPSSVPIVISAGVFMACLTILMIFQMLGFTGEIHPPPALTKLHSTMMAPGTTPLYQNPMVLSGISIVLGVAVIVLGVLYLRSKK